MAGHASPLTTVRYDRCGDEARREAVEHLHFPYRGSAIIGTDLYGKLLRYRFATASLCGDTRRKGMGKT